MKKITLIILSMMLVLIFAGCTEPSTDDNATQLSIRGAEEIAVDFVGYGTVYDIRAFTEEDTLIFEVDVRHESVRYVVLINAESGNVIELNRYADDGAYTPTEATDIQSTEQPTPPTPPNPPSGSGRDSRPTNPVISLEDAIEIAYADLADRGITASYRTNSGMAWERGQWVWELEFRTQGERMPVIEYYINVDTGAIVKFEWDD